MSARPVPFLHVYFAFAAGYLFSYLLRTVNAVISPELTRDLGLSSGSLGLLTSAYWIGGGITGIFFGYLADRYGSRLMNALSMFLSAPAVFGLVAFDGPAAFLMALAMGAELRL